MGDLISRKAVIDELRNMYLAADKWLRDANETEIEARAQSCMSTLIEIKLRIEKMPSAQPTEASCWGCNYPKMERMLPSAEPVRCKDCKHNPKDEWFGCPMSHLSEAQRPETAWCWKAERRTDESN